MQNLAHSTNNNLFLLSFKFDFAFLLAKYLYINIFIVLSLKVKVKLLSHAQLFATRWTLACLAPLSMGFPVQEYWSRLPFPPPGDLPDPGIDLKSPAYPAVAGGFFTTEPPGKHSIVYAQPKMSLTAFF